MRHSIQLAAVVVAAAGLQLTGCREEAATYKKVEPAHVEHKEGSEISKLTLTEKAMERLAVQTATVNEEEVGPADKKEKRSVVPYSAVMYVANGDTFVYTSPEARTFVRHAVSIDFIEGDRAVLKDGPPTGTSVVSVGAAELFGTEFGVGH